jgi:hypothetical protein
MSRGFWGGLSAEFNVLSYRWHRPGKEGRGLMTAEYNYQVRRGVAQIAPMTRFKLAGGYERITLSPGLISDCDCYPQLRLPSISAVLLHTNVGLLGYTHSIPSWWLPVQNPMSEGTKGSLCWTISSERMVLNRRLGSLKGQSRKAANVHYLR